MNKTERMLAIVLELQNHGELRAEDLAATFEVSKRTIYRDIDALSESGVPIASARGHGYSLLEGYFLPPLNFTIDEALMLVLGADLAAQSFDAHYATAAETAMKKIEAVLPDRYSKQFTYLKTNIRLYATYAVEYTVEEEQIHRWLHLLRRAIIEQRQVNLAYAKRYTGEGEPEVTARAVDPYSLARLITDWYLLGYCHLRGDLRVFRLSRMESLTITRTGFQRPPHFSPRWADDQDPSRSTLVQARFTPQASRWLKENPSFYLTSIEEAPDGAVATFTVRHEDDIFQWLLGWGASVYVLEPGSLRERLAAEARQIAQQYQIS